MHTSPLPSLDYFLEQTDVLNYPYEKTFEQARFDPLVVLHTSGSTGIPKPVTITHGTFSCIDAYQLIPALGGSETIGPSLRGMRLFLGFPLFHAASLCYLLGLGIYFQAVCVLPSATTPMTAQSVDSIHTHGNIQASALPPSVIADVSKNHSYLNNLNRLRCLIYAGGSLPYKVGNEVSSKTRLIQLNGSTEIGLPPLEPCDSRDWDYVRYSPFAGNDFRYVGVDDLYEHFIVRNKELDLFQGVFSTFPDIHEYSLKDLYEKHPTKPDLWRFRGRLDDVIVFSNAEKVNPVDMEGMISAHPLIRSAIVGGYGKFQSCLLVEPVNCSATPKDEVKLLDDIWPTIELANQNCPSYGRIMKDFILFTSSEKPVLRTGKGTVRRQMTLDLYQNEIDKLYEAIAIPDNPATTLMDGELKDVNNLRDSLYQIVVACTWLNNKLTLEADFFELGLDSLQVVALTRQVNAYLIESALPFKAISSQMIYNHASILKLEAAISDQDISSLAIDRVQRMQDVFTQYSSDLPTKQSLPPSQIVGSVVILLTGSTGSLGSYLLDTLISNVGVRKVYCLNRGKESKERQIKSHLKKGLAVNFPNTIFLQSDLSKPCLGLDETTYDELLRSVTHIIHTAWDVNFNRSFDFFAKTYIRGVRQLIDICSKSEIGGTQLLFVSSESTVKGKHSGHDDRVHERVCEDWTAAINMGYAESKLVAERLIAAASRRTGFRSTICRVGQIAGPTVEQGLWSYHEWLPSLVSSSVYLGKLPASLGSRDVVDWIPVDVVARIIADLLFTPDKNLKGTKRNRSTEMFDSPKKRGTHVKIGVGTSSQPEEASLNVFDVSAEVSHNQSLSSNSTKGNGVRKDPARNTLNPTGDQRLSMNEPLMTDSMSFGFPQSNQDDSPNAVIDEGFANETTYPTNDSICQERTSSTNLPKVYHIVNPSATTWPKLVPILQRSCSSHIESVQYSEWLAALQDSIPPSSGSDDVANPALNLIDYYKHIEDTFSESQIALSTEEAVKMSPTMATLEAVSEKWVNNWMRQWGFSRDGD